MDGKRASILVLLIAVLGAIAYFLIPTSSPDAQDILVRKHGTDKIAVFVHGVLGGARGTFTNATTKKFWPELLTEDPDMDAFDVISLSFDADVTSNLSLEQIATVV